MFDYREELESAVDWQREAMPEHVREAIGECNASLYYGPDAGAWSAPLEIVTQWAESVCDVNLTCYGEDDDGEEIEIEAGYIDSREIVAAIVGRELARYL